MKHLTLLSILTVLVLPVESFAQAAGPPNTGSAGRQQPEEQVMTRDTMSQSDLKRLAEKIDQWNRVEGKAGVPPRVAKIRTTAMLAVLKVSCVVSDAAYLGAAPDNAEQNVYEAACEDGMGYLLFLQKSLLTGTSCLEAGRDESHMKCALLANADSKIVAGAVLNHNHIQCKVQQLNWLGTSAANLDHMEVACEGTSGYVVRSPRPGSSGKLEVMNCQEANKQGIACQLPANVASAPAMADARPTLAWFKDALSRNGVSCQSKRARIVGRESIKRRYLVEFECSDRPEGLIAIVPPASDPVNSFESMNCASAAGRGIHCEFVSTEKLGVAP
jgi:hypothetical protein